MDKMSTYLQNSEGTFIPATKRPDGTWRKARRVKDGYVPQEEVPLYESKGKQFAQRQTTGVPPGMCPFVAAESKKEREKQERAKIKKLQKETTKNSKVPAPGVIVVPPAVSSTAASDKTELTCSNQDVSAVANTMKQSLNLDDAPETDIAKQIKKLRKKIREIEAIEIRIEAGEVKKLDKDQLDKVKKKSIILEQIKVLEENATLTGS